MSHELRLRALILADHIYRDEGSSKYVIAGTFHQLTATSFPTTFLRTFGIFISFSGLTGKGAVDLDFMEAASGEILMRTRSLEVICENREQPLELALEVPPLKLPRAGQYLFRLTVNGTVLGETSMAVLGQAAAG